MIRVNELNSVNFVTKPAFKSTEGPKEEKNIPVENFEMAGSQALAVYNMTLLKNPAVLDVEPLSLILNPGDEAEGEKIYTSEGKLHSIVKEDENTRTVFTLDEEDENRISSIIVNDKEAGQMIKKQNNYYNEDGTCSSSIKEYSLKTGEMTANTWYEDGKFDSAKKVMRLANGEEISINKDFANNKYYLYEESKDKKACRDITFDKDKKILEFEEFQENKIKNKSINVDFYNGSMISVRKYEEITIPNNLGTEKFNSPELVPAEKYSAKDDLRLIKGEKTYYSNGAIEKNIINNGETTASFNPFGELTKLETNNKIITFENNNQYIEEKLDDEITKTTTYYKDGDVRVHVETKDSYKTADYQKNGKPDCYYEGTIDENGEEEGTLSLYFNESGMLESAYQY